VYADSEFLSESFTSIASDTGQWAMNRYVSTSGR